MGKIIDVPKSTQRTCIPILIGVAAAVACIVGVVFVVLGPVIYVNEQEDIDDGIDDRLVITSVDDKDYDNWRNPGEARDPLYQKAFYFFNLTNPRDVLFGKKPLFKEIGPLFYQFVKEKIDVVFTSDLEFVSYKLYSRHYYKSEYSKDPVTNRTITPSVRITTVNPDWMTAVALAGSEFSLRARVVAQFVAQAHSALKLFSQQYIDTLAYTLYSELNASFPDDWRTGNPGVNYTLDADYSGFISSEIAARLFDPLERYSLVNPTEYVYWRNSSGSSAQNSATIKSMLETHWGINSTTRAVITAWFEGTWLAVANPTLQQSLFGYPAPSQWPGAQWGSLDVLQGIPLQTAACTQCVGTSAINPAIFFFPESGEPCSDDDYSCVQSDETSYSSSSFCSEVFTCYEYACWRNYRSGEPCPDDDYSCVHSDETTYSSLPTFSPSKGTDLLEGTSSHSGFIDSTEVETFFTLMDQLRFADILVRYDLNSTEATAIHEYFLYIIEHTMMASVNAEGGYGTSLGTGWEGLFVQRPAEEIIFGKTAPLLGLVDASIPFAEQLVVLQRNDSSFEEAQRKPQVRVNTGYLNLKDIGRYELYDGQASVDYWAEPEYYDGTDGSVFPKPVKSHKQQRLFSTTLGRNVLLQNQGKKSVRGTTTRQWGFDNNTLASRQDNPDNAKYFTYVSGYQNFTTQPQYPSGITGVQLFYSRAHNLGVEDEENNKLLYDTKKGIEVGLPHEPLEDLDLFYRVEPRSGRTFDLRERYQVNYRLTGAQLDYYHAGVQEMFFPIFWYDEGFTITSRQANAFEDEVTDDDESSYRILWSFLLVGSILLAAALIIIIVDGLYVVYLNRRVIGKWLRREKHVELEESDDGALFLDGTDE